MSKIQDVDPASGELLAEVEVTTSTELSAAVARARAAAEPWAALDVSRRLLLLAPVAERLEAGVDELAACITGEMGKTLDSARKEVLGWAAELPRILEEVAQAVRPWRQVQRDTEVELLREPHGVVAAIAPWNFPLGMPLDLILPALGTGNTVVFKPSEHVPLVGARLAALVGEGLPAGVLELVQGAGELGAELVASDVDMVAFVGSRDTGRHIMSSAAGDLKRLVLELGGKDPVLIFADADLQAAADSVVQHSLRNTGQVCCSVERVYVAEEVARRFETLVVERAATWRAGPGLSEDVQMGPLVSEEQRARVAGQVEEARAAGARCLLGGEVPEGVGWFYPATVLAGVDGSHALLCEETFGPVISMSTFSGAEDEAVRLANDTPYGLGANVWTSDSQLGQRVARRIRAGQVGINRYLGGAPGTPWVGARQSGFGFLGGVEGHRQFTTPKTIAARCSES